MNNILKMLRKIRRSKSDLEDLLVTHYKSPKNKINRNEMLKNYEKNNYLDTKSSQRTNKTENSLYSKKTKNTHSQINSPSNSKYNLICRNCYKRRINSRQFSQNTNNPNIQTQKEKLNLTFNEINPFYFYDKMQGIYNNNKQDKLKDREERTKKVINNLEEIRKKKPSEKENLQYNNEYAVNSLNFSENKDPRYERVKKNYDLKEKILAEQRNLYHFNYNEPRKAIKEYYNKTMYEIPVQEIKHEISKEYKKNYINDLKKQINEKEEFEKNKKKIERNIERKANKDYNNYINNKLYNDNLNKIEQQKKLRDYNEKMINLKKEKEEEEKNYKKDYERKLKQKIIRENDEEYYNKMLNKIKNIEQMKNWMNEAMNDKFKRKKEEDEEKKKWKNYSEEIEIKCQHGNNIYKCSICNKIYPREQLIKIKSNFLN